MPAGSAAKPHNVFIFYFLGSEQALGPVSPLSRLPSHITNLAASPPIAPVSQISLFQFCFFKVFPPAPPLTPVSLSAVLKFLFLCYTARVSVAALPEARP
jgi:hypothetical protein